MNKTYCTQSKDADSLVLLGHQNAWCLPAQTGNRQSILAVANLDWQMPSFWCTQISVVTSDRMAKTSLDCQLPVWIGKNADRTEVWTGKYQSALPKIFWWSADVLLAEIVYSLLVGAVCTVCIFMDRENSLIVVNYAAYWIVSREVHHTGNLKGMACV